MIPFNRPFATGGELASISLAIEANHLSGNGPLTAKCAQWLEAQTGSPRALLTHSCTAALELAAVLADVGPGDEVIMPSFTFSSTANAFVLRGATPVFVDVSEETLNLDVSEVCRAVGPRTRAIVPVHYAGVACELDEIVELAADTGAWVIEDAAQGLFATYRGRELGSVGRLGALSFHETKNVISGEGGALLVNDAELIERAEIVQEKGTDRSRFFRGEVDKYTWVDIGGSYSPSELIAAFLWTQLQAAAEITDRRVAIWNEYHRAFEPLEEAGVLRRPIVPEGRAHNGHMYFVLLPDAVLRPRFIELLAEEGVQAVIHYVPLHDSPAGLRFGRTVGDLPVTNEVSARLVRLPLWTAMTHEDVAEVVGAVAQALDHLALTRR
jgi:dTDP-4-amino-4,6-dideoxygalactose transaminase